MASPGLLPYEHRGSDGRVGSWRSARRKATAHSTTDRWPVTSPGCRRYGERLGGEPAAWQVREVGDGNLNLVFIVEGPDGDLCVKQALPYVRLVGEGWPLDLKRAWFEHRAASIQSRHAAGLLPELLHFDERLFLIAMECCRPHIIIVRREAVGPRGARGGVVARREVDVAVGVEVDVTGDVAALAALLLDLDDDLLGRHV